MAEQRTSIGVDPLERAYWIAVAMAIAGWTIAGIGVVGELLGWWKDVGESIVTAGSMVGTVATLAGLGFGAGRKQVGRVEAGVGRVEAGVGRVEVKLDGIREDLHAGFDRVAASIDRGYDEAHEQSDLLAEQSDLLAEQTALLAQIRDRLPSGPA